jgi:hypothetical protein
MIKKLLFAGALVGVLSLMGYGVYEAVGGTGAETHAGIETGRYAAAAGVNERREALGRSQGQSQGQSQGGGRWATEVRPEVGQAGGGRQGLATDPAAPDQAEDWAATMLAGTVVQLDGSELVLLTAQGEQVTLGLGKSSYWQSLGITLQAGDPVEITGFWEDGEFEVQTLTATATAQTAVLRGENGRPLWAGGGRWAEPTASESSPSF